VIESGVLVLNRSWVAVHVVGIRRAVSLVYRGLARVVNPVDFSTYDFDSWRDASGRAKIDADRCIHTVSFRLLIPEVIQLCLFNGRVTQKVKFSRRNIFERDGYTCQYCARRLPTPKLTLDHIVPRSRGGHSTWENIVVACIGCNDRKANRLPAEAGLRLIRRPTHPQWANQVAVRLRRFPRPSWERFLETAYWETELKE